MKTLLTFAVACLVTLTTIAADRYPDVTIKSKRNFIIMVDGRRYFNDNFIHLDRMRKGVHTIAVFEKSRGFFGNRMRMVSSRNFMVRNNDLRITIDYLGRVDIDEVGNNWGRNHNGKNRDWDKDKGYDRGYDEDHDRNYDRGYDRNKRF